MTMRLNHNFQKTYNETFTRTVGAATRAGVRGIIPTKPNDTTGVFVSPNGNDTTGTGVEANPVRTLGKANTLATGVKKTIWFFRNGSNDPMEFAETIGNTLTFTRTIAVEDGETATLDYTQVGVISAALTLVLGATFKMNGLEFKMAGRIVIQLANGDTNSKIIENCTFSDISRLVGTTVTYAPVVVGSGTNWDVDSLIIRYCYMNCALMFNFSDGVQCSANNNIFHFVQNPSVELLAISINSDDGREFLNLTRNIFIGNYGSEIAIKFISGSFGSTTDYNVFLKSCFFANLFKIMYWFNSGSGSRINHIDVDAQYNQFNGAPVFTADDPGPTNLTISVTDTLDEDTPNMFFDEDEAINNNYIEGFRLQREGLLTPDLSGKYFLDSPLVGAGVSGVDVNPFDESIALNSEFYDRFVDLDWVPASMNVVSNHINPVNNEDVRGNLETDYDSIRRVFSFGYGDSIHISNNQIKKLNAMNSDKGSKEFYPLGIGGNMFDIDAVSSGIFSSTDNSLQPSGVLIDMVVDHWRGFWLTMGSDKYYINSNDETKMYLVDKRGAGFPSTGSQAFIVEMILINTEKGSFTFTQSNFTEFLKGGSWREDPDEVRNYDYTLDNLDLKEIEDDKENL